MNRTLQLLLAVCVALSVACQVTPPNPTTYNFARPAAVAMLCTWIETDSSGRLLTDSNGQFVSAPSPRPIRDCRSVFDTTAPVTTGTGPYFAFRLFSLVTQTDRGEVAVVNLHTTYNTGIVDNDPAIPGFTFIPVGSFPTAIAVHPSGAVTYVANSGENSVSVIDNSTILRGGRNRQLLDGAMGANAFVQIRTPERPGDLAIGEIAGRTYLYIAFPLSAQIAVLDVTDPSAMPVATYVTLGAHTPGLDGGAPGPGDLDGGAGDGGTLAPRPERIAIATADTNAPEANGDVQALYVSDSRSTFIHVLTPLADGSLVEGEPLEPGMPTRPLTVTPTILTSTPNTRFVYAGGANDGTLVVIDTATRRPVLVNALLDRPECQVGNVAFNLAACPRIDSNIDWYRVPVASAVISLATVTRDAIDPGDCRTRVAAPTSVVDDAGADGPSGNPAACSIGTSGDGGSSISTLESGPAVNAIRGVAVVVGMRNSQLRIIDVEDWQANCNPERRTVANLPLSQPHTMRAAVAFPSAELTGQVAAPTYSINGSVGTPGPADPQFAPVDGSEDLTPCLTAPYCVQLPLIRAADGTPTQNINALAIREDTFTLTYEGIIPGLTVRAGAMIPSPTSPAGAGRVTVESPGAQFCVHGAVPGDWVSLSDMSPCAPVPAGIDAGAYIVPEQCNIDGGTGATAADCATYFGTPTAPCNRDLVIESIAGDTLTLSPAEDPTHCAAINGMNGLYSPERHRDLLRQCYPQAFRFDIRPRAAWTVYSAVSGYVHDDVCMGLPANPLGRVTEGTTYRGNSFSLRIVTGSQPTQRGASYRFSISGGFTPLAIGGGLMPSAMHYSCTARRLYLVDEYRASLVEYPVAPMSSPRTFN